MGTFQIQDFRLDRPMKYYSFQNKYKVPAIGLGTWKSEKDKTYQAIREAINIGYRHFDCAFIYENEIEIGRAIQDAITAGEVKREELWITSKLWNTHHRGEDVFIALKHTLQDFGLKYLDLYLMHWPVAQKKEVIIPTKAADMIDLQQIPLQETWQGMEECVMSGMVRNIGVSNFSIKNLKKIQKSANIRISMNQVELHPLLQQNDLLEYCQQQDILVTAYSPLGSRDRHPSMKAKDEADLFTLPEVTSLAEKYHISPAQLLIAWAINRGTLVVPKSTNPQRMKENLEASEIILSQDDLKLMEKLDRNFRYVKGDFFCFKGSSYTEKGLWES